MNRFSVPGRYAIRPRLHISLSSPPQPWNMRVSRSSSMPALRHACLSPSLPSMPEATCSRMNADQRAESAGEVPQPVSTQGPRISLADRYRPSSSARTTCMVPRCDHIFTNPSFHVSGVKSFALMRNASHGACANCACRPHRSDTTVRFGARSVTCWRTSVQASRSVRSMWLLCRAVRISMATSIRKHANKCSICVLCGLSAASSGSAVAMGRVCAYSL